MAERIKNEIQAKVEHAGIEIVDARITNLAYAPECGRNASAPAGKRTCRCKKLIVEGAVGMVEMALARLKEFDTVDLDEERKAAMVSNLLVVLCGNKDVQPVVNSGSLY